MKGPLVVDRRRKSGLDELGIPEIAMPRRIRRGRIRLCPIVWIAGSPPPSRPSLIGRSTKALDLGEMPWLKAYRCDSMNGHVSMGFEKCSISGKVTVCHSLGPYEGVAVKYSPSLLAKKLLVDA